MKFFKKKSTLEDNKIIELENELKENETLEETKQKSKTEKIAKTVGKVVYYSVIGIGTVALTALVGLAETNSDKKNSITTKDWRDDEDLLNDIDYSSDTEEAHQNVLIALDMTDLEDEEDCVKTYQWLNKNLDSMPKVVKTVISMTRSQINQYHIDRDSWYWDSDEEEIAQKAMKQLKKYYSKQNNESKIIIVEK